MSIALPDFATLDQPTVDNARDVIQQWASEAFGGLDFRGAALADIVVQPLADLHAALSAVATQFLQSTSLVDVNANPAGADATAVDRILANYGVTRRPGVAATGTVLITLNASVPLTIPVGFGFSTGTARFVTATAYAIRTSADQVISSTDVLLTPNGNGKYSFSIAVVASTIGAVGVRRLTVLQPDVTLPNVVSIVANSDFTNGVDPESNTALLARFEVGIAPSSFADANSVAAILRKTDATADIVAVSVVGYGDPEQLRHHGLTHGSGGGRVDVWVKPSAVPDRVGVRKTAVALGIGANGQTTWQVSISKTDMPGFYNVDSVTSTDGTSVVNYQLVSDLRGYDPTGSGYVPDVTSFVEAAYSTYQTATIQFSTPTAVVPGTTQDFLIYLRGPTQLQTIADTLTATAVRPIAGDVLVRGAVPCDVHVSVTLLVPSGVTSPDTSSIAQAAAQAVASTGFDGVLSSAFVAAAVNQVAPARTIIGHVSLTGSIRLPDGTTRYLSDVDGLTIPNEPANLLTRKTTCFYLDAANVDVTVSPL